MPCCKHLEHSTVKYQQAPNYKTEWIQNDSSLNWRSLARPHGDEKLADISRSFSLTNSILTTGWGKSWVSVHIYSLLSRHDQTQHTHRLGLTLILFLQRCIIGLLPEERSGKTASDFSKLQCNQTSLNYIIYNKETYDRKQLPDVVGLTTERAVKFLGENKKGRSNSLLFVL